MCKDTKKPQIKEPKAKFSLENARDFLITRQAIIHRKLYRDTGNLGPSKRQDLRELLRFTRWELAKIDIILKRGKVCCGTR